MRTKTAIAFSCPKNTAKLIDEYASQLGISRSACITMMCNAYIVVDGDHGFSGIILDKLKAGDEDV